MTDNSSSGLRTQQTSRAWLRSHARAGWSSPSAAAATASLVTVSPMGESSSISQR
ncbi:MAG: hypothetical protein K0Q96_1810 [Rubrobacteraceae bacterium]|nr:hypothetical protein [Rubrobacteraceae bacterium]